ncbi:ATP-binding protein [Longispora albida]|uniref:ATP-binding protein n=1 Tax=Longispora albida TaxID=203523 RepID=UPI00037CFED0|nr:AAA family ATPase [Longispora albida]
MQISSPAIIGRQAELAALDSALRAAARGEGRAVFLLGEAGIGKSRLTAEAAGRAFAVGVPVLRGRATASSATMPFRPLAEAMSSLVRASGPPQHPELVPFRPALARLIPEWRSETGPAASLAELAEALLRLFGAVGSGTGCLLILEDLHDADAESLAVIEYLVDNLAGLPVLLLGTLRPENCPALTLARSAAQRRAAEVAEPRPLSLTQVGLLAASCLGVAPGSVPSGVVRLLARDSGGNPFVAEELLASMVGSGVLSPGTSGWELRGELEPALPGSVVTSIADRAGRLGQQAHDLLRAGAVLGQRFALPVLQAITGLPDRALLAHLRAATEARLIAPDETRADWYAFRHALTAEALLAGLMPAERAAYARQAADAIEKAHPGLEGDWCQRAARLRLTAGQTAEAAALLADAGRRVLATGASTSALALLEQAYQLREDPATVDSLLHALADAGQYDRAIELTSTLGLVSGPEAIGQRVLLHSRLGWALVSSGRPEDAEAQVRIARDLLRLSEPECSPEHEAAVDVVEARLAFMGAGQREERMATAERLASQAAGVAERVPLPEVACQAWQVLAGLARRHGYEEADAYLEKMLAMAERHGLHAWRVDALLRLGANEFMRTGESTRLHQAMQAAQQLGSIVLGASIDVSLSLHSLLRGDYPAALEATTRWEDAGARLQNAADHQVALFVKATVAAHQGRRQAMEAELATLHKLGGEQAQPGALVLGLCRAVCALLEEDLPQARRDLDEALAWERENPTVYYLAGQYGLRLLAEVHAGAAGWPEHEAIAATPAARLRWNQQFVLFAEAILLGRSGKPAEAEAAFEAAIAAAEPFPLAAHLGRRIVAEAAIAGGWGSPALWLRPAEEYFHRLGIPAAANACRVLLRQAGASAGQRRTGHDQIPAALRDRGVTVREFDVFELLPDYSGNKSIAQLLFISPRTVEKHVASLLAKTGLADRAALSAYARECAS